MLKNKILTKITKLSLLFSISISIVGCSSQLVLRRSASENFLLSIKSTNSSVKYLVNSSLPEKIIESDIIIPFNKAFKDRFEDYMNAKFNNISQSDDVTYVMDLNLKDLDLNYRYNMDLGSAVSGGIDPVIGQGFLDITITTNVKIKSSGQIIGEKNIVSTTSFVKEVRKSNSYTHKKETYEEGLTEALNKNTILIDKYLASLNI